MTESKKAEEYRFFADWVRAKQGFMDCYFTIINNASYCYNRWKYRNEAISGRELDNWRSAVRSMFIMVRPYESDFKKKNIDQIDEDLRNIEDLMRFTDTLLRKQTVINLVSLAKEEKDPIDQYEVSAYK